MSETTGASSTPFATCVGEVRRLHAAVETLARACGPLQIAPLAGREWYELLTRKLLPQLSEDPFIVAAVVGGTNIGKSVIFNHLAGCRASATSPLASGTKHPVCLVPPGFTERHNLYEIFQGFELHPWTTSEAALEDRPEHRVYWRESERLPGNLLVLDTPDIDSDAAVNWLRADCIRHCADVLIAVLTQQKYNDAAVKQFFRKAAAEDKAILVVFNQCLLPEDEAYWPLWLATFSRETGIEPDLVYLAPYDRRAAEEERLPFYRRGETASGESGSESAGAARIPGAAPPLILGGAGGVLSEERRQSLNQTPPAPPRIRGGEAPPTKLSAPESASEEGRELARDLAEMHFVEIKLRTLRGALGNLLSPEIGIPAFLADVRNQSAAFQSAADVLSMQHLARIDNWPAPPARALVSEIRQWWNAQRQGITRTIHNVYGTVGEGLAWPFRWAKRQIAGDAPDPRETYRRLEWEVILQAVDSLYDELTRLSQLGNDLLRPRLEKLLAGASRSALLERLARAHAALDLAAELRDVVQSQMQTFRSESPNAYALLKRLDALAAVARPVTSVVLFFAAAGPVGNALMPMVTDAAAHSVVIHVVGDIAGGTGAVVMGETALTSTAGGLRHLEAKFQQLQAAFTARRVTWFAEFLKEHLLGELQHELQTSAGLPQSEAYRAVEDSVRRLTGMIVEHADSQLRGSGAYPKGV